MKKKLLFSVLMIIGLLIVTGCSNSKNTSSNNLHKVEFVNMKYNEPKNYSKKEPVDIDENKILIYRFNEDENKTINLYYYKNKKLDDTDNDYEKVMINGMEWRKYHNTDFGVTYDTYECVYNNGLYTIELNVVDQYKDEFDEFMKDVSFE